VKNRQKEWKNTVDKQATTCYNLFVKKKKERRHRTSPSASAKRFHNDFKFQTLSGAFVTRVLSASALFILEVLIIAKLDHQLNEEIRDKEVRLIGDDGAQLGIMSAQQALSMAMDKELDLVKISPNATPPVCKIMDYGKFRFEQMKKEKEAKKNQRVVEVKEIRMSPNIDTNDFNVKVKNAQKFLKDGNRVKVSVRFRGREMAHTNLGEQLLKQFGEACAEMASVDKAPKLEGRNMSMFLSPKSGK